MTAWTWFWAGVIIGGFVMVLSPSLQRRLDRRVERYYRWKEKR